MARRPIILWLTILGALAAAAWGFLHVISRPPRVETAQVRRETVERVLAVTGRVRPRTINQVRPLASGRLLALPLDEGDRVEPGDLLARVDASQDRAALEEARAATAARRQDLAQARRELERAQRLFTEELIPQEELERRRLAVETGKSEVRQRQEAVTRLEARLADYVLRSPLEGRVLDRPVDPGQIVGPDTVLYEIATDDDPWIEAEVDEIFLAAVAPGQGARVSPPGGGGPVMPATVAQIGRRVDPETGAATVRLTFDGEAPELPAGMSLDVNIRVARHEDVVTVPRAAVADPGGDSWVLTVEKADNGFRARRRPVSVLDWPAPRVVVHDGLEPADRVLLSPRAVEPGAAIRLSSPSRPEAP